MNKTKIIANKNIFFKFLQCILSKDTYDKLLKSGYADRMFYLFASLIKCRSKFAETIISRDARYANWCYKNVNNRRFKLSGMQFLKVGIGKRNTRGRI